MPKPSGLSLLLVLGLASVPAPAAAMSDGNRALLERNEAEQALAADAGEVPADAPAGGSSGPRAAGVASGVTVAFVIIGLIIVAALPLGFASE